MERRTDKRLMLMMFLQYAVWGAWLPIAAKYLGTPVGEGGLGFSDAQIGLILGLAASIGAVTSPFIAGQFADRYFPAQHFLSILLLIGGAVQIYISTQTTYLAWLLLAIAYSVVYMPTLALSNSVAFAHMDDQEKQFPLVRVWGTIGWIAASWAFPMIWLQQQHYIPGFLADFLKDLSWIPASWKPYLNVQEVSNSTARIAYALKFSGIISIVYAVFGLLLPNTPPKREAVEKLAFAKAFRLLKHRSFAVLFFVALPIAMIHQIYFLQTSPFFGAIGVKTSAIQPAMTLGQFAEILVMAVLGLMLVRLGFKAVITMGIAAYVLRYAIFGTVTLPPGVIVASQFLHGFCYACFFAASYIYVDRIAPPDIRHSAQTMYGIFILGLGPVLGGYLSGQLSAWFTPAGLTTATMSPEQILERFRGIWYCVSGIALVTGVVFLALFHSAVRARDEGQAPAPRDAAGPGAE